MSRKIPQVGARVNVAAVCSATNANGACSHPTRSSRELRVSPAYWPSEGVVHGELPGKVAHRCRKVGADYKCNETLQMSVTWKTSILFESRHPTRFLTNLSCVSTIPPNFNAYFVVWSCRSQCTPRTHLRQPDRNPRMLRYTRKISFGRTNSLK